MKKKQKQIIHILLAALYSLTLVFMFANEITICISSNHIGFKSLDFTCCKSFSNSGSSIEDNTNSCLDLKLLYSKNTGQHLTKQTRSKKYYSQNDLQHFVKNLFSKSWKSFQYQQSLFHSYKTRLPEPSQLLYVLRNIILQL